MRSKARLLLAACLLLASMACATEGKLKDSLDHWIGLDVDEFILKVGQPESTTPLNDGTKMMVWNVNRGYVAYAAYGSAMGGFVGCQIRLVVDSTNSITKYAYSGNNCKAK